MRIKKESIEKALLKAQKMSLKEKEHVVDEIFNEQPNLLASVLCLQQIGNSLESIDVLLNILIVAHLSLRESGVKVVKISEQLQEKEMARFVEEVKFTKGLSASGIADSLQQYAASKNEQYLLAFSLNEMMNAGFANLDQEQSKYLIMAGVNIVNCISSVKLA